MGYNCHTAHVCYWNKFKNTKKKKNVESACFSAYNQYSYSFDTADKNLTKIYYKCPVDASLTKEEINFYFKFVRAILPKNIFKYRFIKENNLLFILNCVDIIGSQKILLALSLFRAPDEQPEMMKNFYENRSKKLEDNFILFQKSHEVPFVKYSYGRSIHCVVPDGKVTNPVSYKTYKERLKQESLDKVMTYFSKE